MATVPPGNKQIGDYTLINVYGLNNNFSYSKNYLNNGFIVAQDPGPFQVKPIKNLLIGDYTINVVYSSVENSNLVKFSLLQGLVVVKQLPTTVYKNYLTQNLIVVGRPTVELPPVTPTKNVGIGDSSINIVYEMNKYVSRVKSHIVQGFVVVKEIKKRKETTTFNVSLHTEKLDFNAF